MSDHYMCTRKCNLPFFFSLSVSVYCVTDLPLFQELWRQANTVSLSSFSFQVSVGLTSTTHLTSFLHVGGTPSVLMDSFIRGLGDVSERNMQVR